MSGARDGGSDHATRCAAVGQTQLGTRRAVGGPWQAGQRAVKAGADPGCSARASTSRTPFVPAPALAPPPRRVPTVRVQGLDREDMGTMPTDEARQIAREDGVDLVMISPDASPPVCRLISFSKYKYESERATKQKQKASKG